jgi:hypothetical protein
MDYVEKIFQIGEIVREPIYSKELTHDDDYIPKPSEVDGLLKRANEFNSFLDDEVILWRVNNFTYGPRAQVFFGTHCRLYSNNFYRTPCHKLEEESALGVNNCNPEITVCSGGSGSRGGGSGNHATIDSSTFTFSGGSGNSFNTGGGGEHLVSTSERIVTSGSFGIDGESGGRSVCDVDPNTGDSVCQTTGKP